MRIATYAIALNEEKHVERWAESSKDADYQLILDTGSTDNTLKIASELGVNTAQECFDPFDFAKARNAALALVPEDIDYCITLDIDEVLHPGWREAIERLPSGTTRPRYKYVWSRNPDGSEGLVYQGHSAHHRHGYEWRHPVHEIVTCVGQEVEGWCDMVIEHKPDGAKSRDYYLPMLEAHAKNDPESDRAAFYYARELYFRGMRSEAATEFKRHLALPSATWKPERAASMRYLAECEPHNKEHLLLDSVCEAPAFREGWVDLAKHYYEMEDWVGCYYAATRAMRITEKPLEYFCEAHAWNETPHDLLALSAYHLGRFDEAVQHGRIAQNLNHSDQRLADNLVWYRNAAGTVHS